jgi:hypothetical protein
MKKLATLLMTTAAVALSAPSFAADPSVKAESSIDRHDNGGYTKKVNAEKTNAAGTTTSAQTEVDLSVDDDGNATKTTTTKEATDPKGLWNKDTTKTKTTEKLNDGKLTVKHEKTVNGTTVIDKKSSY